MRSSLCDWWPCGPVVSPMFKGFLSSPVRVMVRTRSCPSSTSAALKLIRTWGATSLSATGTVMDAAPVISYSGSAITVKVSVLSGISRQSSGGVKLMEAVTSPGAKTTLDGASTASERKFPARNPPGSSTATPTIRSSAVLLPRVRVNTRGSPSVMPVEFADSVMVDWSSSRILPWALVRELSKGYSTGRISALMTSETSLIESWVVVTVNFLV